MEVQIFPYERIDDLQYKGLRIIQNPSAFCFGTDAVLLAGFAEVRKGEKVVDLGTGTGIIPILLAGRTQASMVIGIEIQEIMAEMAGRSVALNDLQDRISIVQGDLRNAFQLLNRKHFDVVVSNPPYKKEGSGIVNEAAPHAIARHEILCNLEDVVHTAAALLHTGGRFCMIHQTDRMMDILFLMRQHQLEPKRIRMVHPSIDKAPNLMLVEGVRNGKPFLKWMPPLIVFDHNGNYTEEMDQIYHRGK